VRRLWPLWRGGQTGVRAKAGIDFAAFTARLKAAPFKAKSKPEFFATPKRCSDADLFEGSIVTGMLRLGLPSAFC